MKSIMSCKWITRVMIPIVSILLFTGCGGGGSGNKWGIDHRSGEEVSHGPFDPQSGKFRCELDDAMFIKPGAIVEPLSDDTELRVWHFQNSEEYVCTLKGEAWVIQPEGA